MTVSKVRLLVAATVLCLPAALNAQGQKPSSAEAQRILQTNPALVEQLRQSIMSSGLTPEQVRARLQAEGYPENLLDKYLGTGLVLGDTTIGDSDVFSAVSALGLADSIDVQLLACGLEPDTLGAPQVMVPGRTTGAETSRVSVPTQRDTSTLERAVVADRKRKALTACFARLDSLQRPQFRRKLEADSGFAIFGLETFRQYTTLFDANAGGPVDASYRLGPGDRLVLVLTGDVEASYQLDVTREGFIVIPQIGQLFVNNLTLAHIEDLLFSKLARVYSGVRRGPGATTHFYITPARLRSNQIFVHGDVMRPGSHRVSSAGTAMTALYAAGGPTDNGSLRHVEIRRGGRAVQVLDVYKYLLEGDASGDVRLENSDVVFVPMHRRHVRVVGEVARPATYEMTDAETLADAIRFAGGFKPTASRRRVQIERILPPAERGAAGRDRIVTDVSSPEFETGYGPAVPVYAGDIVRIFPVASRVRNRVMVNGNVWTAGAQGINPGQTRISDVLRGAGGVKPDTYLGQILVARLGSDSTRTQLRTALRDTLGNVVNDFLVDEDDEIRVFSRSEFREPRYVAITGAVHKSGRYPFRGGMTVRDLVLLAGGLEQSALLREAEIARLPESRAGGRTARTFRVPLDSSYVFERGTDGRYLGPPGLPAPNGDSPDVQLQPYDNLLILRQPDWELQRTVSVSGEVMYPGRYALQNKSERITDIIRRVGGLTREAYAGGVAFYRRDNGVGRIGIELPEILRSPRGRDNLILLDGDSIFIPRYNGVVNVTGLVNSPVAVAYVEGRSLEHYVRAAGGPAVGADLSRAYVTQPNGKVEAVIKRPFAPDAQPRPGPGSTVFVPERDSRDAGTNYASVITTIAQLITTLVATVAVVKSL